MKKSSGSKTNVIMGLLAVLVASIGYLIFQQDKEGFEAGDINEMMKTFVNEVEKNQKKIPPPPPPSA
jgi:hypothetical protein